MDSSVSYNVGEHTESSLEVAYQEALRNTESIVKDEAARRLRLRILMLENENDDLHEQLALGDDRIDVLEQEGDELREQLERAHDEIQRHEADARVQTRELNNLRAALTSMNGVTMDTTKLLTEKLSLARELATLKPELEHLRSQASYQQITLSEKLALQRQVSTLEVEIETEKRASKRAAEKNDRREREADLRSQLEVLQNDLVREKNNRTAKEVELQSQLESLQKDLAREKKEGGKTHKEVEKELKASETRHTVLESKLDQMRTKLRATKEELKECQTELTQARAAPAKTLSTSASADASTRPRKRAALEMSTDVNIGTPDGVAARGKKPAVKRGRKDQTMVGEKSMFSITPFLNRTMNMALDTPAKDPEADSVEEEDQDTDNQRSEAEVASEAPEIPETSTPTAAPKAKGKKKVVDKPEVLHKKALGDTKSNTQNKKPAPKKRTISTLEKVTEEDVDENEEPRQPAAAVTTSKSVAAPMAGTMKPEKLQSKAAETEDTVLRKKKRKLLGGKTLFDEEDGEATKRPTKASLGAPRLLAKGGLAGPGGGLRGGLGAGMGTFSPLKKDRRGVGASFLA
ncbi:hypothetical protein LHYA1_G008524 [Lachnellula hyalina]|uniref:Uncharacterized protein n=1 Tax=Lachnellula hyalina TaxID=1316788 RepID=A0A8H8QTT7_9HELO|nr:uncharacterized protein LHYA1_G008524 [Lachnellula hyalina]TVY22411.1 hypothetical protein LHYA1_G008524 [Lachnellula hyalina]